MDSALPPKNYNAPVTQNLGVQGVLLPEVTKDTTNDDSGLKSKKFIVTMTLLIVASIFTGMGIMTIDQWLWFCGAIGAGYGILNVGQKKLLQ